jgi:molybdopterin-guanine dinucleotide biosynthesis protein A
MSVTAIVLAGGRSARFGSDKLAAELDGAPLLAATIAAVAQVADGVIVAAGSRPDERIARDAMDGQVSVVLDHAPFAGPLAALSGALDAAADRDPRATFAIVVGGDMPRLVPAVLRAMLDRLAADAAAEAIILELRGAPRRQVLPLAARVAPARRAVREALASDVRSLHALVGRLATIELPTTDWRALDRAGATLADVDTAADLERLRSHERGA